MLTRLIVILFIPFMLACGSDRSSDESNLKELDRIIGDRQSYISSKRNRIDMAKNDYARAETDSDRYNVLRSLYKEYRTFRIDSAVIIADQRLEIARRTGDKSKITSATLNLAEGYVKSGSPMKAIFMLDTLDKQQVVDYHRKYITSIYKNAYMLLAETEMIPAERVKAMEKVKSLRTEALKESEVGSRGYYTIMAENFMDSGLYDEAVAKIEEADRLFDFSNDAAMQYTMGKIYLAANRKSDAIKTLSRGAIIDLSSGVKEYQALIQLASLLFEEGDVERAFVYINCALEDTQFSNANFRNPEIMVSMPVIDQAFHAYERKSHSQTVVFLWIAGGLVALLVLSIIFLLKYLRTNKKMLATIADINLKLEQRNRELEDADKLKLHNINTLIMSNARYIARLKEYRKTVYRLMKTGQYERALDALKSDKNNSSDISAFHEMFDEAFLSMFPDFLKSVNNLLREPLRMRDGMALSPELRVIALMRLGLSSTEEIAGILHYSSQTVYNLRSTIRSMSFLSREDFEEAIKRI